MMAPPPPPTSIPPSRRTPPIPAPSQSYMAAADHEDSDDDSPESVKNWDEEQVCDYLRSVKCGEYERLFRKNHINGENLLELDKDVLKEMGIEKVGDRVRLFLGIKKLRTRAHASQKKRTRVRVRLCCIKDTKAANWYVHRIRLPALICTPQLVLRAHLASPNQVGHCLPPSARTSATPDSLTRPSTRYAARPALHLLSPM